MTHGAAKLAPVDSIARVAAFRLYYGPETSGVPPQVDLVLRRRNERAARGRIMDLVIAVVLHVLIQYEAGHDGKPFSTDLRVFL